MAASTTTARKQWQNLESVVNHWLEQRQRLLHLIQTVDGATGTDSRVQSVTRQMPELCQQLMDYVSAGYFEVYRQLLEQNQHFGALEPGFVNRILRGLEDSTDAALAFNADFDTSDHCQELLQSLPARLSLLLEKLEERFALEDQLMVSIHQSRFAYPTGVRTVRQPGNISGSL